MVHTPAATPVTVLPLTVQIDVVIEAKVTARPELAVAFKAPVPPTLSDGAAPNVMVWAVLTAITRVMVMVRVSPLPVPVIVIGYVPGEAVAATETVVVQVPFPIICVGLNETVTPAGCPEALRVTPKLSPPVTVFVMVELEEFPGIIVRVDDAGERAKVLARVEISAGCGLPHPVTRSNPGTAE